MNAYYDYNSSFPIKEHEEITIKNNDNEEIRSHYSICKSEDSKWFIWLKPTGGPDINNQNIKQGRDLLIERFKEYGISHINLYKRDGQGKGPGNKGSQTIKILFDKVIDSSEITKHYRSTQSPLYIGSDKFNLDLLQSIQYKTDAIAKLSYKISNPILKDTLSAIRIRRGQAKFRRELLKLYNKRCAVTGCEIEDILEAAHIVPYAISEECNVTNGILLRSDIHTLFDLNKIQIEFDSNTNNFLLLIDKELSCRVCHKELFELANKPLKIQLGDEHLSEFLKNLTERKTIYSAR